MQSHPPFSLMQRLVIFLIALSLTGCPGGQLIRDDGSQVDASRSVQTPGNLEGVHTPNVPVGPSTDLTLTATAREDAILNCLAPPPFGGGGSGSGPYCNDPCLGYLSDDVDAVIAYDSQGIEFSLLLAQLQTDEEFSKQWNDYGSKVKQACLGLKFKVVREGDTKDGAKDGVKDGGKDVGKEGAEKDGPAKDEKPAPLALSRHGRTSIGGIEEAVLVIIPFEEGKVEFGQLLAERAGGAVDEAVLEANIQKDGLADIKATSPIFVSAQTRQVKKRTYFLQKEDGTIILGTSAYLQKAYAGPDVLSCLAHPMSGIFARFNPANFKAVAALPEEMFQEITHRIFVDGFPSNKHRHLAAALNVGSRAFIHLKGFAGPDLAPIFELLAAVDTNSLEPRKAKQLLLDWLSGHEKHHVHVVPSPKPADESLPVPK